MAHDQHEAFAEKTRELYRETFGINLEDQDFIAAIEKQTMGAKESFLAWHFDSAGLTVKDLEALRENSQAKINAQRSISKSQQAEPSSSQTAMPKFKKSNDDEWMFNFDE